MMPIKDTAPSRKFPFFTLLLVIANIAVFGYEISIYKHLDKFIIQYGFIPARMWQYPQGIISWFSSMFLHGGFLHIIGNMYFLWIFGDNVESRLGHFRFLFFYLFCGIAAAGTHAYFNSASLVPTVGASGAISGILGAYFSTDQHGDGNRRINMAAGNRPDTIYHDQNGQPEGKRDTQKTDMSTGNNGTAASDKDQSESPH